MELAVCLVERTGKLGLKLPTATAEIRSGNGTGPSCAVLQKGDGHAWTSMVLVRFAGTGFNRLCDVRCHNLALLIIRLDQVFLDAYGLRLSDEQASRLTKPTNALKSRIENSSRT